MAVNDTEAAMNEFMDSGGWDFPVMIASDDLAVAYDVQAVPTLVLIDPEGRIVDTLVGGATASELSEKVEDLGS